MQEEAKRRLKSREDLEKALASLESIGDKILKEHEAGLYAPLLVGFVDLQEAKSFLDAYFQGILKVYVLDSWLLLLVQSKEVEEVAKALSTAFMENFYASAQVLYYRSSHKVPLKEKIRNLVSSSLLLRRKRPKASLAAEEDLLFLHLVEALSQDMALKIQEEVLPLYQGLSSELQETLRVFHGENLSMGKTAKRLYVHRNTLIYRLDKIEKITGMSCKNIQELTLLCLAQTMDEVEERV